MGSWVAGYSPPWTLLLRSGIAAAPEGDDPGTFSWRSADPGASSVLVSRPAMGYKDTRRQDRIGSAPVALIFLRDKETDRSPFLVSVWWSAMTLKDKLLCEALRQFSTKGYAATSTSAIIEGVGASKGGLYNHFHNKEELFLAALSLARHLWRERNLFGLSEIERPLDKIIALLDNYRDRYLRDCDNLPGGCVFVNLAVELGDQNPHLGRQVGQGFSNLRAMLERLLGEERERGTLAAHADPAQAAEVICSGILGACVVHSSEKSSSQLERTIAALIAYVEGLKG